MKTSLLALADLVSPRVCVVCGRVLIPQEHHICICCLADLPQTHYSAMSHNPMADRFNELISRDEYEPYAYAAALYFYKSEAGYRRISQALKYHRDFGAGKFFARMLGSTLAASPLYADVDMVIPVPLHWTRKWERGYNQADIIAKEVACRLGAACCPRLLRRRRKTRTQTRLNVTDKAANVAGAFAVRSTKLPQCTHILLVDDVFTTGATMAACYTALRAAYPATVRISVATLAVV